MLNVSSPGCFHGPYGLRIRTKYFREDGSFLCCAFEKSLKGFGEGNALVGEDLFYSGPHLVGYLSLYQHHLRASSLVSLADTLLHVGELGAKKVDLVAGDAAGYLQREAAGVTV